jgi:hypothetical protein
VQSSQGNQGTAGSVTVTDDTTTNATRYVLFDDATSGSVSNINVSSTKLTFNPSTGTLSATEINSTSDINKKTNIRKIENAIKIIENINGFKFNWKDNNNPSLGVIAQELELILPELVTNDNITKTVNYNGIIAVLIEGMKEQQEQIKTLKNHLNLD